MCPDSKGSAEEFSLHFSLCVFDFIYCLLKYFSGIGPHFGGEWHYLTADLQLIDCIFKTTDKLQLLFRFSDYLRCHGNCFILKQEKVLYISSAN
ncbi:hypothetical protein BpHYR1_007755 [Brachionus plicatilis]|uniref:Uncharacterized protein n=1 Tax=Brachionus plicatilis TaxID=10195 RepID=A0A3M7RPL2_BRAPC|nr:hypothetical protein BpHYR1_007755 [Brachionus plicatilis]